MGRNAYCMRFRPVPSEGESFMASKQKILIVDDDNNIAELISLYLTKECYDTKIVNDGEEAVREFHRIFRRPDALFRKAEHGSFRMICLCPNGAVLLEDIGSQSSPDL